MRGFPFFLLLAVGVAWLGLLPRPLSARPLETTEDPPQERIDWYLHGNLDLRYTYRGNKDDNDSDLYEYLSLSFGQKDRKITGYISGRVSQDLDGRERPTDSFSSIADTHDRFYARLNAAYVDVRFENQLETVRIGRQWLAEVPEVVRMDGLRLKSRPLERTLHTRIVLFGGIPEHFEESSRNGDRVFGGGFEFQPFRMTRLSLLYSHIRDEYGKKNIGTGRKTVTFDDDLVSVVLRQHFLDGAVSFYGLYTNLNGDSREANARFSFDAKDGKTSADINYRTLFSTQASLSTELDPFVSILREYQPYHEVSADVRRTLADHFEAEAGAQVRRLRERADKGPFNREFERYYLSGFISKWPARGSLFSLTGDLYDADSDRFWAAEGSYEHKLREDLKVAVGSGYSLYHESRFTFEERSHVRTGFARVNYDLSKNLLIIFDYTAERDDFYTTHTVETTIRFRF